MKVLCGAVLLCVCRIQNCRCSVQMLFYGVHHILICGVHCAVVCSAVLSNFNNLKKEIVKSNFGTYVVPTLRHYRL